MLARAMFGFVVFSWSMENINKQYCMFLLARLPTKNTLWWNVVPQYDVTSPFQADESGNFLSYKFHEHARQKRGADEPNVWYYHVEAFGMSLHLNLTKNSNVLAPGMVVETVNKNGSTEYSKPPHTSLYDGHVTSDPNSMVAVGNHDGLVSVIQTAFIFFLSFPQWWFHAIRLKYTSLNQISNPICSSKSSWKFTFIS